MSDPSLPGDPLPPPPVRYVATRFGVHDLQTGEMVLPGTAAWRVYLDYLAAGGVLGTPPGPPPPTAEEVAALADLEAQRQMRIALRAEPVITFLRTHTPAEAEAWVNTNVTDLASARNVLSKLAAVVAYLARERLNGE